MFSETMAKSLLGLADIEQSILGTPDTVDEVGGGAGKSLPHLKGLSRSLDEVEQEAEDSEQCWLVFYFGLLSDIQKLLKQ